MAATTSNRCDRIIALIDACLDEMAVVAEQADETGAPVLVGSSLEGGPTS